MENAMSNKTAVIVTYPIVGAIGKIEEFLQDESPILNWEESNEIQQAFMNGIYAICSSEIPLIQEIESIANLDSTIINEWLEYHGFNIKLGPFPEGGFGTASKLDLTGYWKITGTSTTIYISPDEEYPGVKMLSGYELFKHRDHSDLIVQIHTEGGDEVYFMMAATVPSGLSMVDYASQLQKEMQRAHLGYSGLIFPMIDLDVEGPLDWVVGLKAIVDGGEIPFYEIAQALQQTKLKMNHKGFRIKSAVAMGILAGAAPRKEEPYLIDRPFIMWVSRPGLKKPLFVGYLNKDVWKNPEGLEM